MSESIFIFNILAWHDGRRSALARKLHLDWQRAKTPRIRTGQEIAVIYTHYDYLEVSPGVSREHIEAAYARVLERFNDGMAPAGQDLSGLVRMIHAAYEVLSDPQMRRFYDRQLEQEARAADAELCATLTAPVNAQPRYVQDVPAPLNAAFSSMAA